MIQTTKGALIFAIGAAALPLHAAPATSVWNTTLRPPLPYQYIEIAPPSRLTPQIANPETYVSDSLFLQLYPSISTRDLPEEATSATSIASKTREIVQNQPRGILSSSYVQELAYVDTYSNIRRYEEFFSFPSIRMSLAMPRFGNGFGGGYQPLQFGFSPVAFKFW